MAQRSRGASYFCTIDIDILGGLKSKPLPNYQKTYVIILRPVIEIRSIRQIKIWIKHYSIIR